MEPTKFREQNATVGKPPGMTDEECGDLPACRPGDGQTISCWKLSWRERLKILFTGRMWFGMWQVMGIPPVWLSVHNPFVYKRGKKGGEATER